MIIAKTRIELDAALSLLSQKPGNLALVPTMGNLHKGHLSLLKLAKKNASKVITTIFVNPLQFSENEDYHNYPRSLEIDIKKLSDENCDILYSPKNKEEMFGPTISIKKMKSGPLGKELCGALRSGHFDGMLTVVYRIFDLLKPNIAIFGAKDFQQQLLIKKMVEIFFPSLNIITAPIIRNKNGLALSSRNNYLSKEEFHNASNLYKSLKTAVELYKKGNEPEVIIKKLYNFLNSKNLNPNYIEIRDTQLNRVTSKNQIGSKLILASINIGDIRIIDNIEF